LAFFQSEIDLLVGQDWNSEKRIMVALLLKPKFKIKKGRHIGGLPFMQEHSTFVALSNVVS
jgi:hypothetical protein